MEVIHVQHPLKDNWVTTKEPCVMVLGFFDGLHLGHRQLIAKAKQIADHEQLKLTVMTFFPHPTQVVKGGKAVRGYITPLHCKVRKMKELGVERLIIVNFDRDFARLSPSDFISQYVLELRCKQVVVGFDFQFGYKGEGNIETLRWNGKGLFGVHVINKFVINNQKVSSTLIRNLIHDGEIDSISTYLGNQYECEAEVKSSVELSNGILLTATVFEEYLIPPIGFYGVSIKIDDRLFNGYCYQTLRQSNSKQITIQVRDCMVPIGNERMVIVWKDKVNQYNHEAQEQIMKLV